MEDQNNAAFGNVSEKLSESDSLFFEDNFTPELFDPLNGNRQTPNTTNQENESWRADGYLASLEAKLKRLKGKPSPGQGSNQRLTSRDMLRTLDEARHDSARHLVSSNAAYDYEDGDFDSRSDTQVSALKRKMFPEQALSAEELQELVKRDFLQSVTEVAAEETAESENCRKEAEQDKGKEPSGS
ncbi:uncharacterized protein [Diadema antillarum]|uniref:uncharacterized protein n=1 Tax=Diadema antillarum TaxID=105358 RepID=UPI003A86F125